MLTELAAVAQRIDVIRRLLGTGRLSAPALDMVGEVLGALHLVLANPFTLLHIQPVEADLSLYERKGRLANGTAVEGEIRSLAYLSLPGPRVSLFEKKEFTGARLDLEITAEMASPPHGEVIVVIPD